MVRVDSSQQATNKVKYIFPSLPPSLLELYVGYLSYYLVYAR